MIGQEGRLYTPPREEVQSRAIEYIKQHFGSLSDLPKPVIPVVWVTIYRGIETGMMAQMRGGPSGLTNRLVLDGIGFAHEIEQLRLRFDLLVDMIECIRSEQSHISRLAVAGTLVDMLKWGITDAPNMSVPQRIIARQFAKADREYKNKVPAEVMR